jgi:hypothetical protein
MSAFTKHSDGSWRDAKGFAAVVMLRKSGQIGGDPPQNVFEFVVDHYGPPIRIIWRADMEATLVDPTYLAAMIQNGYARNLTDAEAASAVPEAAGQDDRASEKVDASQEPGGGEAEAQGSGAGETAPAEAASAPNEAPATNEVQQALQALNAKRAAAAKKA